MKINSKIIKFALFSGVIFIAFSSCKKLSRPGLGDFPKDQDPRFPLYPGGPLKFYASFDGTTSNPLMNAVDSIRANFPSNNPLISVDGVNGKSVQGGETAIVYPSANDFNGSTSCTISMWVSNIVNPNTELYFSLVDSKDYWHQSAAFLLVEHATADACTFKFALQDHWVEYTDKSFKKPLFDGQWHHIAFTYDETTSKLSIYFDGVEVPTPGTSGTFTSGGAPLGKLDLKNATNLVLGGWNKHAGFTSGPPQDDWIKPFSGKMDQFRLYGKVLSASEILALYNSKL